MRRSRTRRSYLVEEKSGRSLREICASKSILCVGVFTTKAIADLSVAIRLALDDSYAHKAVAAVCSAKSV